MYIMTNSDNLQYADTMLVSEDKARHYNLSSMFGEGFISEEVKKWMRMAKSTCEVEHPCLSRQIGVVIADPRTGALVSSGHNGPPDNTPGCDDHGYLRSVVWPQLTEAERFKALEGIEETPNSEAEKRDFFTCEHANMGVCPRRIVGAPSGQRLELCTCAHGETNAIVKAHRSVAGCWMFCWCGVPCIDCTKLIINSRVRVVVALNHGGPDYSPHSSRWLFKNSRTDLVLATPEWVLED